MGKPGFEPGSQAPEAWILNQTRLLPLKLFVIYFKHIRKNTKFKLK